MSNIIKHKSSNISGLVPSTGSIDQAELAINIFDGKLYTKNSSNSVINLGVTSISGTSITPDSGNFTSGLYVNGVPVSLSGHQHNDNNDDTVVRTTGTQSISGIKTFDSYAFFNSNDTREASQYGRKSPFGNISLENSGTNFITGFNWVWSINFYTKLWTPNNRHSKYCSDVSCSCCYYI